MKNAKSTELELETIFVSPDSCGGHEEAFVDWLRKNGYSAEIKNASPERSPEDQDAGNLLWDEFCRSGK